jgi:hypothetical protein
MKFVMFLRLAGMGALPVIIALPLRAQDDSGAQWNHFGLNFRTGFNIRTKFSEPSSLSLPPGPGAGLALNHQYRDGFVNADSSGNQGGVTWNWGYQSASQISGGDVLMHANGGLAGADEHYTGDPSLGLDFSYVRDIGHYKWGQWGIKIAFGYSHISVHDDDAISANLETATDKYALNGVVPPLAPYTGSFNGPGPVLGSEPISRSISSAGAAIITGDHKVDADLYDLRVGPSVTIPLLKRFSVQGGGGLALGILDSRFSFSEYSTTGPIAATGSEDTTGLVPGAYAEVGFAYRLCRAASVFTGVQYEYLGDFRQGTGGRSARLEFGQSIFYEVGLQWHF